VYGKGISKEGSLLDVGVTNDVIKKSGAWFTYEGDQLGQGREKARDFLAEYQDIALEIERRIREIVGLDSFGSDEEVIELDAEALSEPAGATAG
jgi:recombination protein RecA